MVELLFSAWILAFVFEVRKTICLPRISPPSPKRQGAGVSLDAHDPTMPIEVGSISLRSKVSTSGKWNSLPRNISSTLTTSTSNSTLQPSWENFVMISSLYGSGRPRRVGDWYGDAPSVAPNGRWIPLLFASLGLRMFVIQSKVSVSDWA